MDPFTQRMLERARARRGNLGIPGNSENTKRSPLLETSNTGEQKLKVTAEEFTVDGPCNVQNIKGINVSPTRPHIVGVENKGKENSKSPVSENEVSGTIRDTAKMRLKRLGALYSGSSISSPIHRTEEKFAAEAEKELKPNKSSARLNRLAALATTINEWEDDLHHPLVDSSQSENQNIVTGSDKSSNCPDHFESHKIRTVTDTNEVNDSNNISHGTSSKTHGKGNDVNILWDKAILETLDGKNTAMSSTAKSAALSGPNETQEYDETSPRKAASSINLKVSRSPVMGVSQLYNSAKVITPPEKPSAVWKQRSSPQKSEQLKIGLKKSSSHLLESSPNKGSVLHKAAIFESGSPDKRLSKDPAELSVAERLALFEKNKGDALLPKSAFSMAIPTKYLNKTEQGSSNSKKLCEKSCSTSQWTRLGNFGVVQKPVEDPKLSPLKNDIPQSKVLTNKQLFETGAMISKESSVLQNVQSERQREIEMLNNRWNRNKQIGNDNSSGSKLGQVPNHIKRNNNKTSQHTQLPPSPPPLPQPLPTNLNNESYTHQKVHMCEYTETGKLDGLLSAVKATATNYTSPLNKTSDPRKLYPVLADVRKFKIGEAKPGRLYPCLSDIESCTETESEIPDTEECESSGSNDSCSNLADTSFGREILHAATINKSPEQEKSGSDLSQSESDALREIDNFLDEALKDSMSDSESEGPTPPKRTREQSLSPQKLQQRTKSNSPSKYKKQENGCSPISTQSESFRYTRSKIAPMDEGSCIPAHVVDNDQQMPLMHTVSFYRRQQNMALKTPPVRQIVRKPDVLSTLSYDSEESFVCPPDDRNTVRNKISALLDEVTKQQTIISQASQALNLCCATVEFSGSAEQVEGERLLLLATHRRQAALHEIQRLEVEGTLRPGGSTGPAMHLSEQGTLIVTNIILPVKKEYIINMGGGDTCHHFMCLVRSQEQVLGTPILAASSSILKGTPGLQWKGPLKLNNLYTDFKATLEVYSLETQKEILPHNIKYHIANSSSGKKENNKLRLTPKKLLKQESRLIMPSVQSPAGPSAVRTSSFQLAGYVVFSLKEVHRTHFTLNKVVHKSPLEGNLLVQLASELSLNVKERGFLTMFEDVSGFGAWHRRWCLLKGSALAYWKYPDDECKKEPIGWIDLKSCSTDIVGLVSRDICARPNTFLLETTRSPHPDDVESLILIRSKNRTTIRHLLSADTKEERLVWCSQLNKTLSMIRAWSNNKK